MDMIITFVLTAIPALLLGKTADDWRKSQNHWFILSAILFVLSVFWMIADWRSGLMTTLFSLIVYVIVGKTTKKK